MKWTAVSCCRVYAAAAQLATPLYFPFLSPLQLTAQLAKYIRRRISLTVLRDNYFMTPAYPSPFVNNISNKYTIYTNNTHKNYYNNINDE